MRSRKKKWEKNMTHIAACDRHHLHRETPLTHIQSHEIISCGNAIWKPLVPCSLIL